MRISDWSSDVCSSDLRDRMRHRLDRGVLRQRGVERGGRLGKMPHDRLLLAVGQHVLGARELDRERRQHCEVAGDRKSAVLGKGVSVRVDLGGRRIIKNKNHDELTKYTFWTKRIQQYKKQDSAVIG